MLKLKLTKGLRSLRRSSRNLFAALTLGFSFGYVALAFLTSLTVACSPARWHETKPVQSLDQKPRSEQNGEQTPPDRSDEQRQNPVRLDEGEAQSPIEDQADLDTEPTTRPPVRTSGGKFVKTTGQFFVIENVATERLRVYERCGTTSSQGCQHRLVLEVESLAGEDTPSGDRRSKLGNYRIHRWLKFYEDRASKYPSWYHSLYPTIPGPGADLKAWANEALLPARTGVVRGAFGWYTAQIGPNADEQWTHGTWGWGLDGNRFISVMKNSSAEHDEALSSHGCTRVENRAIAFMREILPAGTPIIKVYAREAYRDAKSSKDLKAPQKWEWILTTEGVDREGPSADRKAVEAKGVRPENVLEMGTYELDQTPTAVALDTKQKNPHLSGDVYRIGAQNFRGYFLVDEGRLVEYKHPRGLAIGGYEESQLPKFAQTADAKLTPASK